MRLFNFSHRLFFVFVLLFCALPVLAQDDEDMQPIYLTMRLFEVRMPRNQGSLSDQVFRVRTAGQTDDEKWVNNLKKTYPEAKEIALLRTQEFRLFRRPRPGIIVLGDAKFPHVEVQVLLAQGLRDDDTINTTALTEVNFYNGPKSSHPVPMSMSSNGFEIEAGMTYFFTSEGLRLRTDMYTVYLRERSYSPNYESFDPYMVVALTWDKEKPESVRLDDAKSADLQAKATRKPEPTWPETIKKQVLFGKVQVRTEINAEGKVTAAQVWQSTLPDGNAAARAAALQWEFPATEMAGIKAPVSALLTFSIAPPPAPKAPEKKPEEKKPETKSAPPPPSAETKPAGETKPVATVPTTKKPPVKRPKK